MIPMKTLALGAALLSTLSGASESMAACDPTLEVVEVSIVAMAFVPADLEICVGQVVRWTNNEPANVPRPMRHTVTADPSLAFDPAHVTLPVGVEPFDSGALLPGQTFERTFDVAGEYNYICRPHERMGHLGRLVVVEPEIP